MAISKPGPPDALHAPRENLEIKTFLAPVARHENRDNIGVQSATLFGQWISARSSVGCSDGFASELKQKGYHAFLAERAPKYATVFQYNREN